MPAYVIGRLNIHAPQWLKEYAPKTQALIAKHGGRYLVRGGGGERVEGDGAPPNATVVLEFPDLERANAWYRDPEYRPLIELRQTGASGELVIVEGIDG